MLAILLAGLVLSAHPTVFSQAPAQKPDPKPAYDFSLSREEKIKLAESAAPPEISSKATIYVLERTGYVKAREGTNGFSCFVDRQTPFNEEPTCFDAEGSATTLLTRIYAEDQRAKGKSEDQIKATLEAGYKTGEFHAPRKPGIVYMLSDKVFLFDADSRQLVHAPPHLMFYAPYATLKDIGSPPPGRHAPPDPRGPTGRLHHCLPRTALLPLVPSSQRLIVP